MKPFHFKKFTIQQSKNVFRVGTDGVLLGAMRTAETAKNILEVGTGTGLISLMIAQRNQNAKIFAVEINPHAAELAKQNFENSPFHDRLEVICKDFKALNHEEKFDLIVSNPPYFEENASEKDFLARQQTELKFEELISKSASLLSENGIFSVIIPFESGENFIASCSKNHLFLQRKVIIYGIKNSKPKRLILEFGFKEKQIAESDFIIEKFPRIYSEEYLKLTEDFHLFKAKENLE